MIDRGANGFAIATIIERRGIGAMVHRKLKAEFVERFCRHAGLNHIHQHIECFGGELARFAHGSEIFWTVQFDLARLAARRFGRIYEIHGCSTGLGARKGRGTWGRI